MKITNFKVINKKILSLLLALGFTVLPVKGNCNSEKHYKESNIIFSYENNKLSYKRFNEETGEYTNISIFDEENIESKQYGANQRVFKHNFDTLINDPYVWEEIQNYFPKEMFESIDEAMFFYQKYFEIIYDSGCGYAAACDYVFQLFEGHEKEFKKCFGYPMYTVNDDGFIDFNYEIFMLKFFDYYILENQYTKQDILDSVAKDMCEYRLNNYSNEVVLSKDIKDMTTSEFLNWNKLKKEREIEFKELYSKWKNSTNKEIECGIPLDAAFGYLYVYLANYGLVTNIEVIHDNDEYLVGDIIASEKFSLQKDNSEPIKYGSHYVYVTEIGENGEIIVSSWGDKYIFDDETSLWKSRVLLKTSK